MVVACTGPLLDVAAKEKAWDQMATMGKPSAEGLPGTEVATLYPLLGDYGLPRSNHFVAEVYFSDPNPLQALDKVKRTFKFFGYGAPKVFWQGMRCYVSNLRGTRALFPEMRDVYRHRAAPPPLSSFLNQNQNRHALSLPGIRAASVSAKAGGVSRTPLARQLGQSTLAERRVAMEAEVLSVAGELLVDASAIDANTPLMEAGIDSLTATELSSRLHDLTGVALSPTLLFEHPTSRSIAEHVIAQQKECGPADVATHAATPSPVPAGASSAVSLVGGVGSWPGGATRSAALSQLRHACGDAVGGVPSTRWTGVTVGAVAALSEVQATAVRYGGFITGAQHFANGALTSPTRLFAETIFI